MRSGSASSPSFSMSEPRAFEAVARVVGTGSTIASRKPATRIGRWAMRSFRSVRWAKLPIISADFLFVADRSSRPRSRIRATSASDGASR
jgi:hypothetical protein